MNSDPTRPRLGLGYKTDPPDSRDHVYGKTGAPLGATILREPDVTAYVGRVRDQGSTSSCVGQSLVAALEIHSAVRGEPRNLSAAWCYAAGREAEKPGQRAPLSDDGSFPRLVMQAVRERGILSERNFPFSEEAINQKPSPHASVQAFDAKGLAWYQIEALYEDRIEQLADALRRGFGVIVCMDVSAAYQRNEGEVIDDMGKSIGGHAQAVVKVDDDYVTLLNSWGTKWGSRGLVRFSRAFFGEAFLSSLIVVREVPLATE